jgi:hypothetical protein
LEERLRVSMEPIPVADGPIAQRFDEPPGGRKLYELLVHSADGEPAVTEAEHLHAAQLAAREHVSPHIRAAAAALTKEGGSVEDACVYLALSDAIDGQYDSVIVRVLRAVIRFTEGGRT